MPAITMHTPDGEVTFQAPQGGNLLEAAIAAAAPLEYVCKAGRCCSCKIKVLEGARQLKPPTAQEQARLGHDKLKRNWRLACQTQVPGALVISLPPRP